MNRRSFIAGLIGLPAAAVAAPKVEEHRDDYYDKYWDAQAHINKLEAESELADE